MTSEREAELTRLVMESLTELERVIAQLKEHIIDGDPVAHEAIRKALEPDDR